VRGDKRITITPCGSLIVDTTMHANMDVVISELDALITVNGCHVFRVQPHISIQDVSDVDVLFQPLHVEPLSTVILMNASINTEDGIPYQIFTLVILSDRDKKTEVLYVDTCCRLHLQEIKIVRATRDINIIYKRANAEQRYT
ncbi:MAG: hypothetical protein PHN45_12610, partial [Methylococcales bacterium]|nr:hypothetical protein [Methylococcales bacterium]